MSLGITCTACCTALRVDDDAAGKYVRCPCGEVLVVPDMDFSLVVPPEPEDALPAENAAVGHSQGGRGVLVLILALLGLLVVGAFGFCLACLISEKSTPQQPAPTVARPENEAPAQPPRTNIVVATTVPEERVSVPTQEPLITTQEAVREVEESPFRTQLMLGRLDRLERDKLDERSSSNPDGPTRSAWDGHTNHVRRVAFTEDGRFVLSVSGDANRQIERPADNSIRVWDARTGTQVHKLEGFAEALDGLCVSPGGRFALFGHGGHWEGKKYVPATEHGLFLWDVQSKQVIGPLTGGGAGEPRPRLAGCKGMIFCTHISPDRKLIVAGDRAGQLTCWETETGRLLWQLPVPWTKGDRRSVLQVHFTPDGGRIVVVGYDRTMRIYRTDGELLYRLPNEHRDIIWGLDVAAAKDGRTLALTGGGSRYKRDSSGFEPGDKDYAIRLWDVDTGEVLRHYVGHTGQVCDVAFCADGRHFVSCGHDRTVRLWDLETGRGSVLGTHESGVRSVAVSPDGRSCVSGGYDCKVRFWQVPTQ
jgi:WD40 repeat protein